MMAAFDVTKLDNFGYNETTDFHDPEDIRWSARPFDSAEFSAKTGIFSEESIREKVNTLALEQPYSELKEVTAALDTYYKTNAKREADCVGEAAGPIPRYRRFQV
jgi:bilirubin oxidase